MRFETRRVTIVAAAFGFAMSIPGLANAQTILGDWQGSLKAGTVELRLVIHIKKAADGGFTGTMDSIDQGAIGIPISSVDLKDSKVRFEIDAVHGTYEGIVSADGTGIHGTWSQGQPTRLDFVRPSKPAKAEHKPVAPSDIDGAWSGTLDTGPVKIALIFHIVNTDDGLIATLDSPDQGVSGIPGTVVRDGASLTVQIRGIGGTFEGKLDKDGAKMDGVWKQPEQSFPLVLNRTQKGAVLERKRPQNPTKPYPYVEEQVAYENNSAGIKLAGTLTIPEGKGPFPAVLLITGSGPQDRDESLMGHKPFLVLSDFLTRRGIAVLRVDDRGVGQSGGNFGAATTADFATDVEAGVTFLKTRVEVNPRKIGLIGHSEGGVIAPMVAARDRDVAFIVMMAGTGVPGGDVILEQTRLILQADGASVEEIQKDVSRERELLAMAKQETDGAALEKKARERLASTVPDAQLGAQIRMMSSPWFRYFVSYDPAPALREVKCPVLVLNGEKDLQVSPQQNLPPIRKALEEAGNTRFEIVILPGLNHLFQTAKTGSPSEYTEIEETMSPVAMAKIAEWILKQ